MIKKFKNYQHTVGEEGQKEKQQSQQDRAKYKLVVNLGKVYTVLILFLLFLYKFESTLKENVAKREVAKNYKSNVKKKWTAMWCLHSQ